MNELKDYIMVKNFDASDVLSGVSSLNGWRKHGWHNNEHNTIYSNSDGELDVLNVTPDMGIIDKLNEMCQRSIAAYSEKVNAAVTSLSLPRLNRYTVGTYMRPHVDHIHTLFDGSQKGIPILTVLGILNDDFAGGDFKICGEIYPLNAGDVIIFPSCFLYPHEVTEVTSGTRYSFVSWAW